MARVMDKLVVEVRLGIDRETAETCARLVELYANQEGCEIFLHRLPDGRFTLCIGEERNDS